MKKLWLAGILILGLCTCKTQKDLNTEIKGSYSTQWENINELINKGFPEKAKISLEELIVEARENEDPIVATQAILKKINLKNLDQEDFMAFQMSYLKAELEKTDDPVSDAFLHYTLAVIYKNYWESNRNIIPDEMSGDEEMSGDQYYDTILYHLDNALIEDIKTLAVKDINSFFNVSDYDPSIKLWDYFMIEKIMLWKTNVYRQYLGEEVQKQQVGNLYTSLIDKLKKEEQKRLHLLKEIEQYNYLNLELTTLYKKHSSSYAYILDYFVGLELVKKAQQSTLPEEKSNLFQKGYANFEKTILKGDSVFKNNAKLEIEKLEKTDLHISVEQVIVPSKKSLAFVNYNNLDKVYLKIYKLSQKDFLEERREKGFPYKNRTIAYEKEIILPKSKYKYVHQSTEIEIPELDPGFYGIIMNTEEVFQIADKNPLFSSNFLVSNLTINSFYDAKSNKVVLECINRTTGDIIPNANFKVFDRQYNNGIGGQRYVTIHEGQGNPDFKYESSPNKNLFPFVSVGDQYFMDKNGIYTNTNNPRSQMSTNLLTDRGIYRPGQEIHFQGILYQINEDRIPKILRDRKLSIKVNDNFGNEVMNETFMTDEYGAYSGVLRIPENIQNGNLSFRVGLVGQSVSGYKSVRVEEYKRPKYEITFEEVDQQLALDKTVKIKAKAISFTGVPVSDAKVTYKVRRSSWVPYFYRGYRSYYPPSFSENTLISSGELKTNEAGEIDFEFIAERALSHPEMKSFNYSVEIDVVDNTGETKAANKNISISEQSVFIKFGKNNERNQYELSTVNAENKSINTKVDLLIYRKDQDLFKVNRYWSFPDTNIVNPMDYPDFTFIEKDKTYTNLALERTINVVDTIYLDLDKELGVGNYKVIIKNAEASDFMSIIEINDFEKGQFGTDELFYLKSLNDEYVPGDNMNLVIGSSVQGLPVQVMKYKQSRLVSESWITMNGTSSISELITEGDYGGYSYLIKAFYNNRFYEKSIDVKIPWNHKQLFIKPKTIRYVTEPGATEKWTFVVTDENGNPVKSRLLSSMYDASLDEFQPFSWAWNPYPSFLGVVSTRNYGYGNQYLYTSNYSWNRIDASMMPIPMEPSYMFAPINWNYYGVESKQSRRGPVMRSMAGNADGAAPVSLMEAEADKEEFSDIAPPPPPAPPTPSSIRTNLAEMVFFYPDLTTDENGEVNIEFDNNEALTKWKMQNFAYTKDLKYGFSTEEIVTRKELMIQANQPRFLRVGDKISLSAKLINLSGKDQPVGAELSIYDEQTQQLIQLNTDKKSIELKKDGQAEVFWEIEVPNDVKLVKLVYRITGDKHEDAEQYIIPVMPKDIYLIDSETILLDAKSQNSLNLSKIYSDTKRASALTIETTGSPAWYAIRTLPYLMENFDENSEAVFNRYFANSLALKIINENPLIEEYYAEWRRKGELKSSLSLNESLKKIDLNLTPWLKDALSEEAVMENMAKLFDRTRIEMELKTAMTKLESMQMGSGGFPWYQGGRPNFYMSQYILEGFLRMEEIGLYMQNSQMKSRLFQFCADEVIKMPYDDKGPVPAILIKNIWINEVMAEKGNSAYLRRVKLAKAILEEKWYEYSIQNQVYIAKIFMKVNPDLRDEIVTSLIEKSFYKEQLGRFWNSNPNGIYSSWDISLQASLISLFNEIGRYDEKIDEMKFWLVANKRTNSWDSNIATSSAVYALTLGKSSSFAAGKAIVTSIDGTILKGDTSTGINYEKFTYSDKAKIDGMKEVKFVNENDNKAWVNVHYQFFQDYADVERTDNAFLDIKKEIYRVGQKDELVNVENKTLELGDRIKVRLIVTSDRPMEFVHVSDDRPAGCEPVDLSSGYAWDNRLGYYKSIKDLGTHFFIDHISKGKYVLEYEMFINNLGEFNSGVAEIQNVYAPEFNDYSKSVRIRVER